MQIKGVYERTLYRNQESGYTTFVFHVKEQSEHCDSYGNIVCQGIIPLYAKSMPLCIDGDYVTEKEREIFKVTEIMESSEQTDELITYITNMKFKGIGKAKAEKIVTHFQPDFFREIEKENAEKELQTLLKLDREQAENIILALRSSVLQRELLYILLKYGGNSTDMQYLFAEYGEKAKEKLLENPYLLCEEGILSFYVADNIAKNHGLSYLNKTRIETILIEALKYNETKGNTYCLFADVKKIVSAIQKNSAYEERIPNMLFFSQINQSDAAIMVKEDDEYRIYLTNTYKCELNIIRQLERLQKTARELPFEPSYIDDIQEHSSMIILDEQRKAFDILKGSGVKILVGGPGRGKTTLIKEFIYMYETMFPEENILLCAPTGRASQRMSEVTGKSAYTIHKALDFKPFGKEFITKNSNNPIEAGCIIVDEFSMVDTHLFSLFLSAVKNDTLLILVGDENQLQSVGPGSILRDFIKSNRIDSYHLTSVFRQTADSTIILNSDKILEMDLSFRYASDFEVIDCKTEEELSEKALAVFLSEYTQKNLNQVQMLSTTKKGICGTTSLNSRIQTSLYQNEEYGRRHFFLKDKIIMTRNNYSAEGINGFGYFNGDMGYIKEMTEDSITVALGTGADYNEFVLTDECLNDVSLAYAMTVHKAQGSESEHIIMVVPENPHILLTNYLVYTGVTRAKTKVTILTQNMAFYDAVLNKEEMTRNTGLSFKLLKGHFQLVSG